MDDSSATDSFNVDSDITEGDFGIERVEGKLRSVNFVARIDIIEDIEYEGVFLKKALAKDPTERPYFVINEEDEASFMKADIVVKLPTPIFRDGSGRKRGQMVFDADLSKWNIGG